MQMKVITPERALSYTLSLAYAFPSYPRVAYFDSVLPCTRARNRATSRRRRAPPDGRNSRTYNWRDASALGPRTNKLAPFLSEFSEPPQETTEWELMGYLRSCRSRFSSVSSGTQTSSPGSPGEKTVPNSHLSRPPLPSTGLCQTVQRGRAYPHVPLTLQPLIANPPEGDPSDGEPLPPSRPAPRFASQHPAIRVTSWKAILPTGKPTSPNARAPHVPHRIDPNSP
jgi:hypothetical protein